MPNEWYVRVMGEEIGPLSDDQFRETVAKRQLASDDLVRKWRFGDWVPAANVRGLFRQAAASDLTAIQPSEEQNRPSFSESTKPPSARLTACPDCGKHISKLATSCPNCGRPVTGEPASEIKNEVRANRTTTPPGVRWGLVFAIALPFVVLGLISQALDESREGSTSSRSSTTGPSISRDAPAAINQQVYSRLRDLAVAGDIPGIDALIAAGMSVTLSEGTQVRVIDLGIFTTEIKVESGPHAGRYFIVATEHINR